MWETVKDVYTWIEQIISGVSGKQTAMEDVAVGKQTRVEVSKKQTAAEDIVVGKQTRAEVSRKQTVAEDVAIQKQTAVEDVAVGKRLQGDEAIGKDVTASSGGATKGDMRKKLREGEKTEDGNDLEYEVLDSLEDFDWDLAYRKDPVFRTTYQRVMESGPSNGFEVQVDGTLRFKTSTGPKICIPARLLREVLHIANDTLGYMGYRKTYDHITQNYYRPRLATYVEKYVNGCLECSINKTL